ITGADSRTRATGVSRAGVLARVTVATLLVLAAPAVSFLHTTGILGSGASVEFPHGYAVTLIVTVLVTAAASALRARLAGVRDSRPSGSCSRGGRSSASR